MTALAEIETIEASMMSGRSWPGAAMSSSKPEGSYGRRTRGGRAPRLVTEADSSRHASLIQGGSK